MTSDKLYVYCRENDCSLADIMTEMRGSWLNQVTIGIVYGPRWCQFVRVADGDLTGAEGKPISLDEPFEVRLFNEQIELRWLHDQSGTGPASIISETPRTIKNYRCEEEIEVKKIANSYLLWGQSLGEFSDESPVNLPPGWSRLTEGRIGHIDVPIYLGSDPGWRVQLHTIEYIATYDESARSVKTDKYSPSYLGRHGNASVIDERLISLDFCTVKKGS